jgi:hypothetical protein
MVSVHRALAMLRWSGLAMGEGGDPPAKGPGKGLNQGLLDLCSQYVLILALGFVSTSGGLI